MSNPNQTSITFEVSGNSFQFRIPSMRDDARLGTYIQALIVQDGLGEDIKESQLDEWTQALYRTMATFDLLLEKSSASWAYVPDAQGRPKVNADKLPSEAVQVYFKFVMEVNEFFRPGADATQPAGADSTEQPVAGGANP